MNNMTGMGESFISDRRPLDGQDNPLSILTERQREIAWLLWRTGLSYKEVAARLEISMGTMRKHAESVYRRIGVHSRAELMIALSNRSMSAFVPSVQAENRVG